MDNPARKMAVADRLGPIKARVRAAFDTMAEATVTVPRLEAALARRLRAPLGRLIGAGQARDAFDQRIAHVEAAAEAAEGRDPATRAAAFMVIAQQLVEVAAMLERTAEDAAAAFHELAGAQGAHAEALAALGRRGFEASHDLAQAAEVLSAEAEGHAARRERGIDGQSLAAADLDWMTALYTMDEERRIHARALAQAAEAL